MEHSLIATSQRAMDYLRRNRGRSALEVLATLQSRIVEGCRRTGRKLSSSDPTSCAPTGMTEVWSREDDVIPEFAEELFCRACQRF